MYRKSSRQRRSFLLLAIGILLLAWLAGFAFTVWHLREKALEDARASARMHALNFEEQLTQTLQIINLTASNIVPTTEELRKTPLIDLRLSQQVRSAPYLRSLSLLDRNNRIVASSTLSNRGQRLDPGSFYPLPAPDSLQLHVGRPWQGRDFGSGQPLLPGTSSDNTQPGLIPLIRYLENGHGEWSAVAAINPDYFVDHFLQLLPTDEGRVQLLRYDGLLLASSDEHEAPGQNGAAGKVVDYLQQREFGEFEQFLPDGMSSISAYRASSRFPVVVAVHLDRQQILAHWQDEVRRLALFVLPALLGLGLAGTLLWRREQRIEAQRAEIFRQRQLAASVFDSSSDAIILTTPDANILSVNPAFERISGYQAAEVIGRNPRLLSSGQERRELYRGMWQALIERGHWQGEIVNRHRDGHLYNALLTINAVHDDAGEIAHYVGVTVDVTEQRRHEAELIEAKARAEAASLAKTTFLATMSHELRTPMNGVLGMTDLLLRSELSERQRRQLEVVKQSGESLLGMINEILDYSSIESQGISLARVPFAPIELIHELVSLFIPHASAKGLTLEETLAPDLPGCIFGDPLRLRQILTNLLSNAVKFTRAGQITLSAEAETEAEDTRQLYLCFVVSDSGIGIPADKQALIFDAFAQADGSSTRNFGGKGLGLTVSRKLAESMNGTLTVNSEPGVGSRFTLRIRVDRAD